MLGILAGLAGADYELHFWQCFDTEQVIDQSIDDTRESVHGENYGRAH